jgi:hypothetical protein
MIDNPLSLVVGVPVLSKLLKLCCQVTFPLESSLATNTLADVAGGAKFPVTTYPPSEVRCTSLSNTSVVPTGPSWRCHCTIPWLSSLRPSPPMLWFASVVVPTAIRPPSLVCLILVIELPLTPALYTLAQSTLPVELTFSTSAHWIPLKDL